MRTPGRSRALVVSAALTIALVVGSLPAAGSSRHDDVPPAHPFAADIAWITDLGVASGFPDGTFRPQLPISRQALAAMLHRLWLALGEDDPDPIDDPAFPDVPPTHPFADDITWLAALDITSGHPDGTFRPTAPVSRQALAAMLHQFWSALGEDDPDPIDDPAFPDVPPTHPFADDITWLAALDITSGHPDGTFRPTGRISRGSGAAMLHRLVDAWGFLADSPADTIDATPGDGICADATGACSLRAAVMEANAGTGPDTIRLRVDTTLALAGPDEDATATGDLDVTDDLVVDGGGHTIDADGLDRVLDVQPGATAEIAGATLTGGVAPDGGGLRAGTTTQVTLVESTIDDNVATDMDECRVDNVLLTFTCTPGPPSGGGGIWTTGTVTVVRSTVSNNVAGEAAPCTPEAPGSQIDICPYTGGGGILSIGSTTLLDSTVTGNRAGGMGGGVAAAHSPTAAALLIHSSTVVGNEGAAAISFPAVDGVFTSGIAVGFHSSIVDGNTGAACAFGLGLVVHGSSNVAGDFSCQLGGSGVANVAMTFGPLADNGGPTRTRLPIAPAATLIDSIPIGSAACTSPAPDQRGVARPQGAGCDPGAVEQ